MTGSTIAEYDGECPDLDQVFDGFEEFDAQPDVFADINWPEDEHIATPQAQVDDDDDDEVPQLHRSVSFAPTVHGKSASLQDTASSHAPVRAAGDAPGGVRFSRQAKSILRVWFNEHKDNPYPSSEEKDELAAQTGLKRSQVSLWLVNTRRRYRSRKHQQSKSAIVPSDSSPSLTGSSLSPQTDEQDQEAFKPMDRWKILPLDKEATPAPWIMAAVARAPEPSPEPFAMPAYPTSLWDYDLQSSVADTNQLDNLNWTPSMASYDTADFMAANYSTTRSTISDSTAFSYPYPPTAFSTISSQGPRTANGDRRRRRCQTTKLPKSAGKDRPFHCTFGCQSSFATKHDWQRHEKSQHISLESWTCCVTGGTVDTITGPVCAFCDHPNPDTKHLETHNFSECQEKDLAERTFYRKDHFQQHLRLTHEYRFNPRMDSWKAEIGVVKSRCGFCSTTFSSWAARVDHLAAHFKCHAEMKDWIGDLGFETHIAAIVENAAPWVMLSPPAVDMSIFEMPPPKFPASYQNAGLGGGSLPVPQVVVPVMDDTIGLDLSLGLAPRTLGFDSAGFGGFGGFGNVGVTDWAI